MPIKWSQALAVGIPEVDAHHRELVVRVNVLLAAVRSGDAGQLDQLFDQLDSHLVEQFDGEEKRMRESGYPQYSVHKDAHQRFLTGLRQLRSEFLQKGLVATVAMKVNGWLRNWIALHLSATDVRMANYLLDRAGVARPLRSAARPSLASKLAAGSKTGPAAFRN